MSVPPGPPTPPPYAAGPGAPDPRRPRPSGWWFAMGGALLVAAVASGIGLLVWTLSGFLDTDATVSGDGRPHLVTVDDDRDRVLWLRTDDPTACRVVDATTGQEVRLGPVGGTFEKSDGSGEWTADSRFRPGSGELEVTCAAGGAPVQVGHAPDVRGFVGGIVATVAVPLVLGLAGLVVLLVTAVRWGTGRPRGPTRTLARTGGQVP
ncbi:hypothetical protein AB0N29_03460 [Nocardioides sp. NPDC092400]|uniref:hypothetical protein n=1 Tax=Nocardioides sp. NPDC092400 TaxID=3155196 RepID=UPI0034129567